MAGDDACRVDVLHQLSAARGALEQVAKIVLGAHIETCLAETFETRSEADRGAGIEELGDISIEGPAPTAFDENTALETYLRFALEHDPGPPSRV